MPFRDDSHSVTETKQPCNHVVGAKITIDTHNA